MTPSEEYYINKLYPLKDKVLQDIEIANTPFYLTGTTAISRLYTKHRFSDDLDLFVNYHNQFENYCRKIIEQLRLKFTLEENIFYDTFARFFITENNVKLKIELVNDVKYRIEKPIMDSTFGKIDIWQNILVNKLTATVSDAAKDFSYLLYISYKYPFNCKEMIEEMKQKDAWLDEVKVAENIEKFNTPDFESVNWAITPNIEKYAKDLITIAKDILLGNDNSLYKQ
jgi:hypothetical protein